MDRIIWSLKTTSNWSVQMTFSILGAVLKLLLSKSGKLGMWHLCSFWVIYIYTYFERKTNFHTLQKYWVDIRWSRTIFQDLLGALILGWQPTWRWCPGLITSGKPFLKKLYTFFFFHGNISLFIYIISI